MKFIDPPKGYHDRYRIVSNGRVFRIQERCRHFPLIWKWVWRDVKEIGTTVQILTVARITPSYDTYKEAVKKISQLIDRDRVNASEWREVIGQKENTTITYADEKD